MSTLWQPVADDVWQGRDDSAESTQALRLFQTVAPVSYTHLTLPTT